ncbi:MAG TPA: MFS transporter [Caldilineae bacterium]|nr:MFS transporter [Caldilineae bacterium]
MDALKRYVHTLSLFSRDAKLYLLSNMLISLVNYGGIVTVLANLYLLRLGYNTKAIGLINGVAPLAYALFAPVAGWLGGRFDIRRIMLIGLFVTMSGTLLFSITQHVPAAWQFGWLIATWTAMGLGLALFWVNSSPFLMSATTPPERNHVFSMSSALAPIANFSGSIIAGITPGLFALALHTSLDDPAPFRYALALAGALTIPSILAMLPTRSVRLRKERSDPTETEPLPVALIGVIALVGMLQIVGEGVARTFFNVYLDAGLHVSTAHIGTLMGVARLMGVPAALMMPLVAARWGNGYTTILGTLGSALFLLPLALVPHWLGAGLGFMGATAWMAIRRPAFTVYTQESVPRRWRAAMSGATNLAAGAGIALASIGGGYLIPILGYRGLFLFGASLSTLGAMLFWICFCRPHWGTRD